MLHLTDLFGITTALAADAHTKPDMMSSLPMFAAFALIFYFMLIRPQAKRNKAHTQLVNNLKEGDEVTTNAGILGKITKVDNQFVTLLVDEGTHLTIQKQAVSAIVPKGTQETV